MLATQLPSHGKFRLEFVSGLNVDAHKKRITRDACNNALQKLCAGTQLKQALARETNSYHQIGKLMEPHRKFHQFGHLAVIDAACNYANCATYSQVETQRQQAVAQLKESMTNREMFGCWTKFDILIFHKSKSTTRLERGDDAPDMDPED